MPIRSLLSVLEEMTESMCISDRVYRIGGDEFVVIVTQKPDELDAMTKH